MYALNSPYLFLLQVPAWKRNTLRISIVILAGGLAIILKDNFAYVGAFVGEKNIDLLTEFIFTSFFGRM